MGLDSAVIPQKFGMFTSTGNRVMQSKVKTLLKKAQKNQNHPDFDSKMMNAYQAFFKSYLKTCENNKNCEEGFDTDVREQMIGAARNIAKLTDTQTIFERVLDKYIL